MSAARPAAAADGRRGAVPKRKRWAAQDALNAGSEVFDAARQALSVLPHADPEWRPPETFQDAVEWVQAREAERKRRKERMAASKSKGETPADYLDAQPGLLPGKDADIPAYWLVMNEYLRDLTREDVMALLPWVIDPWDDPDLRMPPLGQRPGEGPGREDADGPAEVEARPASVDAKSRMAQRSPGVTPKVPSPLQQPQRRAPAHRASTANVVCIYSPLGDPGAPTCDACCQPASPDAPLTACSRCGTHIHASCHSDGGAPLPDPWVCEGCEEAERLGRDPECCVCLRTGGVLKHVAGPGGAPGTSMAHQFCAQFLPETFVAEDGQGRDVVMNFHAVEKARLRLTCVLCSKKGGAPVQCSFSSCRQAFHPTCARDQGYRMDLVEKQSKGTLEYRQYCSKHTERLFDAPGAAAEGAAPEADVPAGVTSPRTPDGPRKESASGVRARVEPDSVAALLSGYNAGDLALLVGLMDTTGLVPLRVAAEGAGLDEAELRDFVSGRAAGEGASPGPRGERRGGVKREDDGGDRLERIAEWLVGLGSGVVAGVSKRRGAVGVVGATLGGSQAGGAGTAPGSMPRVTPDLGCEVFGSVAAPIDGVVHPFIAQMLRKSAPWSLVLCPSAAPAPQSPPRGSGARRGRAARGGGSKGAGPRASLDGPQAPRGEAKLSDGAAGPVREGAEGAAAVAGADGVQGAASHEDGVAPEMLALRPVPESPFEPPSLRLPDSFPSFTATLAGDARPAAESGCPSAAGSEGRPGRSWTAGEESEDDESLAWGDSGAGGPTQEVVSAAAPEDEVSAEILELQAELVQVMVANRARLAEALHGALRDVGRQAEGAHHARHDAAVLRHFAAVMRDIKRAQKREKREKAQRQAQVAAKVAAQASQRRGARGADGVRLGPELWREQFKVGDHFVDMLAKRMSEGQDDVCAVCGDGTSEPPNQIVFCERCDLPVHQSCYGVVELPTGEWLCEPCRCHEQDLEGQGMPRAQVRPPRWQRADTFGSVQGGSHSVSCVLCPLRRGAFGHVVRDPTQPPGPGRQWVHLYCAHRHPECEIDLTRGILHVHKVRGAAPGTPCIVCGLPDGACVACCAPGCAQVFHPVCGRNAGFFMPHKEGKRGILRQYCDVHSDAAMENAGRGGVGAQASRAERKQMQVALAQRERDHAKLAEIRHELTSVRAIVDHVARREHAKVAVVAATRALHAARMATPASARAALEGLAQAGEGGQAVGGIPGEALALGSGPVAGAVHEAMTTPWPPASFDTVPPSPHHGRLPSLKLPADLSPMPALGGGGGRGGVGARAGQQKKRPREDEGSGSGAAGPAASGSSGGVGRGSAGARGRGRGRGRSAGAVWGAGRGTPGAGGGAGSSPGPATPGGRGAGAALAATQLLRRGGGRGPGTDRYVVERTVSMTPREAEAANARLPPNFQYLPVGGQSQHGA